MAQLATILDTQGSSRGIGSTGFSGMACFQMALRTAANSSAARIDLVERMCNRLHAMAWIAVEAGMTGITSVFVHALLPVVRPGR